MDTEKLRQLHSWAHSCLTACKRHVQDQASQHSNLVMEHWQLMAARWRLAHLIQYVPLSTVLKLQWWPSTHMHAVASIGPEVYKKRKGYKENLILKHTEVGEQECKMDMIKMHWIHIWNFLIRTIYSKGHLSSLGIFTYVRQ